ncbi:MAG: hypothetical protein H6742_01835 [Alphaproteobacteria bacterium]|nr:hypothetical protein [Alphaproteobacteria bacterium]
MRRLPPVLLTVGLFGLACGGENVPTPWSETHGRQEVGPEGVAAARNDGAAPTATDASPAPGAREPAAQQSDGRMACDPPIATPSPTNGVVGSLTCGGSVEGWTGAGEMTWGDDFYQRAFCTPRRSDYDGSPEVVYELLLEADVQADIKLTSPCTDLDLVAVAWQVGIPGLEHTGRIAECEMDAKTGDGKIRLTTVSKPQRYLVAVDGKEGNEGNFRLDVQCSTYR